MKRLALLAVPLCLCTVIASCTGEKTETRAENAPAPAPPPSTAPADIPIDEMPELLTAPVTYPDEARKNGDQGTVLVKAKISKEGRVVEAMAEPDSNASAALEKAALEAVKAWTFRPAKSKGEPVETWVVLPVKYKLE